MSLTRKEFLKQGFFSLGDVLLKAGETVRGAQVSLLQPPVEAEPEGPPVPDENSVARVDNQRCLARNCGCFSCVERCESQAILVVMGEGIRIDEERCTGCGDCEYVCPLTPKAVRMQTRNTIQPPSAHQAEKPPLKGEASC